MNGIKPYSRKILPGFDDITDAAMNGFSRLQDIFQKFKSTALKSKLKNREKALQ